VSVAALAVAAALLAVERASYAVIARLPGVFVSVCSRLVPSVCGGPVAVVGRLFCAFKALQVAVFGLWCWVHGGVVWGMFLALRFPHDDWYALPVIETLYYAAATRLESPGEPVQSLRKTMAPM
jgi:hypothetical protein